MEPKSAAILGALTADAASLGLHWLYDAGRLRELQQAAPLAFRAPNPQDYVGVPGFFAHPGKRAGDRSCYGEPCRLMLAHLARSGGMFDRLRFQQEWLATFGPGGSWVGYADRPTRRTLVRLLNCAKAEEFPAVSGVDDDQLPALACIPALAACRYRSTNELLETVQVAVGVTHDHPLARDAARACSIALDAALCGTPLSRALEMGARQAGGVLEPLLLEALALPQLDPQGATARFGMPCHLPQGLPVLFHIAHRAGNFQEAVQANILAGGDCCGRSLMLGALTAVHDALQLRANPGTSRGIPLVWLSQLQDIAGVVRDAEVLLDD
ncbi:MAG: ADP-ribosylglycohydrolase family protein [Burkholderiaceae bacterium]